MVLFKVILETVGGVVFEIVEVKRGFFQTQVFDTLVSFDIDDLKNTTIQYFQNCLKSKHFSRHLKRVVKHHKASKLKQIRFLTFPACF